MHIRNLLITCIVLDMPIIHQAGEADGVLTVILSIARRLRVLFE